jgi:transcriptional regulatory protein LevR
LKLEIDAFFDELKFFGAYHYTKQIRKILRLVAKHIKYSSTPSTEVELLIHFCQRLQKLIVGKHPITALENIYARQVDKIEKSMAKLHEDIQFDFAKDLRDLKASIDEY